MDLSKSYEFFQPEMLGKSRIHVIGCGAIGSTVCENLARFGVGASMTLYDFDKVEPHNVANQMFVQRDIGRAKVDAVADMILAIDPDAKSGLRLVPKGWTGQRLAGYVFLCVDDIGLRREIATACEDNPYVKGMFDFRMGLTDAQHYAADWKDRKMVHDFIASMAFTHEEAKEATPVSACNIPLSVCPTVRSIVAYGVANFVNFVKSGQLKKLVLSETFDLSLVTF